VRKTFILMISAAGQNTSQPLRPWRQMIYCWHRSTVSVTAALRGTKPIQDHNVAVPLPSREYIWSKNKKTSYSSSTAFLFGNHQVTYRSKLLPFKNSAGGVLRRAKAIKRRGFHKGFIFPPSEEFMFFLVVFSIIICVAPTNWA